MDALVREGVRGVPEAPRSFKKLVIVGSEAKKFTRKGRERAKALINNLILGANAVGSGESPLGGIDAWTHELADELRVPFTPFPPKANSWEGGYKARNLAMAEWGDETVCITVDRLPDTYTGMRFKSCYHCNKDDHVKSGGCWTMKQAKIRGKQTRLFVIVND